MRDVDGRLLGRGVRGHHQPGEELRHWLAHLQLCGHFQVRPPPDPPLIGLRGARFTETARLLDPEGKVDSEHRALMSLVFTAYVSFYPPTARRSTRRSGWLSSKGTCGVCGLFFMLLLLFRHVNLIWMENRSSILFLMNASFATNRNKCIVFTAKTKSDFPALYQKKLLFMFLFSF